MQRGFRRRLPLTMMVAACVTLVVVAVSGGAKPIPGLEFTQNGHWLANPGLGLVFFVNGSSKSIDAQVPVSGLEPGSQVVQGETSGYVVGQSRIVEFGKSNLSVDRTLTPPAEGGERPVAIETAGGPYLVYREGGRVVRLGDAFVSLPVGGALADPVATPDGTLWLQRLDNGQLCRLPKAAEGITCSGGVTPGHTGALTVVGDSAVFVDTATDALHRVTADGLGPPMRIHADITPAARVAPADAAGRIAVIEPGTRRMYLVDASGLASDREPGPPVAVQLPDGEYSSPSASESAVVLLDLTHNDVLTYTVDGVRRQTMAMPAENGKPELTRGEDKRVYVNGGAGGRVLVVDPDGAVTPVQVTPEAPPTPPTPQPPPSSTQPPPSSRQPDTRAGTAPKQQPPQRKATTVPAIPASPPGIPGNVTAKLQGADAQVTWAAATPNGAAVTAYHVSWTPSSGAGAGASDHAGGVRSTLFTSLREGITYTVTVVAENRAGRGAPATVKVTRPAPQPTITIERGTPEAYNDECELPDCALIHVVMHNFKPGKAYKMVPHASNPDYSNPGRTLTADKNGTIDFEAFHFGQVGVRVWVVADGVKSNELTWRSG